MKRKITQLEQRLIKEEFRLTAKFYFGKHDEKTYCYTYEKQIDRENKYVIHLNHKRNVIIKYGIPVTSTIFVDHRSLEYFHKLFLELKNLVEELNEMSKPIPNELLESVE